MKAERAVQEHGSFLHKCDKKGKKLSQVLPKSFGWGYNKKTLKTETVYAFRMRFYCL